MSKKSKPVVEVSVNQSVNVKPNWSAPVGRLWEQVNAINRKLTRTGWGDRRFTWTLLALCAGIAVGIVMGWTNLQNITEVKTRLTCQEQGHVWKLAEYVSNAYDYNSKDGWSHTPGQWQFACTRCGALDHRSELTMTDSHWKIIEDATGMQRPVRTPVKP
jgi:hypothetical protein